MNRTVSIVLGLLAFAAICTFCALRQPGAIETHLSSATQTALGESNIEWTSISVDGRDVTLTGTAPTPEARIQAAQLAASVPGIRIVNNAMEVGDGIYELRARREGIGLILTGSVPTEEKRSDVVAHAASLFGTAVDDRLVVEGSAPDPVWVSVATDGIELLSRLESGELKLVNTDVVLSGRTTDGPSRDAVSQDLEAMLPEGYTSSSEITIPEVAKTLSDEQCAAEFTDLLQNNRIRFASNSAKLTPDNSPILEDAVALALRCPTARIEVAGYTDAIGNAALNLRLSQERAQAVLGYLVDRGIPSERLVAKGYGKSNPVATNRTKSGRAANRRIQFNIER